MSLRKEGRNVRDLEKESKVSVSVGGSTLRSANTTILGRDGGLSSGATAVTVAIGGLVWTPVG